MAATEVLSTHTPELFRVAVQRAAEALRAGKVVALPTETVYGLAANALDSDAVAEIFRVKDRPGHNPIIVHVASLDLAQRCVAEWPPLAERLARAFWPGPLTLVLPRSQSIPDLVTAGGATVGVRWPAHPFIQAVIRECAFPLAAPSANPSGELSPTTAEHVRHQLGDRVELIIDGGAANVGIESTVLDLTTSPPRILRPGMISESALAAVAAADMKTARGEEQIIDAGVLRSPGLLEKHYAPKAKLIVLSWRDEKELRSQLALRTSHFDRCHILAHDRIPPAAGFGRVSVVPHDAAAFARALYAELHCCDDAGAEWIAVEAPPDGEEWRAIADRLKRAGAI